MNKEIKEIKDFLLKHHNNNGLVIEWSDGVTIRFHFEKLRVDPYIEITKGAYGFTFVVYKLEEKIRMSNEDETHGFRIMYSGKMDTIEDVFYTINYQIKYYIHRSK